MMLFAEVFIGNDWKLPSSSAVDIMDSCSYVATYAYQTCEC